MPAVHYNRVSVLQSNLSHQQMPSLFHICLPALCYISNRSVLLLQESMHLPNKMHLNHFLLTSLFYKGLSIHLPVLVDSQNKHLYWHSLQSCFLFHLHLLNYLPSLFPILQIVYHKMQLNPGL